MRKKRERKEEKKLGEPWKIRVDLLASRLIGDEIKELLIDGT